MPRPGTGPLSRFSLGGKSILVTGATGALGSAAATALSQAGAALTLAGGNAPSLAEVAAGLAGGHVATVSRRPESPGDA